MQDRPRSPQSQKLNASRPTALAGRLTSREFLGLLHVLCQSARSGRLALSSPRARALLILRRGRLVYAASTSARETLGNILVCEQLIDEQTLRKGLEIQHQTRHRRPLGTVLEEIGAISKETLKLVVELQARRVMQEILAWETGFFHFESMQVTDSEETALELDDFVIEDGLRVDAMLFDLSVSPALQDLQRQAEPKEPDILEDMAAQPSLSLRAAMQQITHPLFNAEMTLALLDYASSMLDRGVLLIRRSNQLLGMAQFGLNQRGEAKPLIRKAALPLEEPSHFQDAVQRGETVHGLLPREGVHVEFLELLGTTKKPLTDAVILPLIVRDEAVAVFYGDTSSGPIASVVSLEALMLQASTTLEKNLLQRKVQALEEKLREQKEKEPDIAPPAPFPVQVPEPSRIENHPKGTPVEASLRSKASVR